VGRVPGCRGLVCGRRLLRRGRQARRGGRPLCPRPRGRAGALRSSRRARRRIGPHARLASMRNPRFAGVKSEGRLVVGEARRPGGATEPARRHERRPCLGRGRALCPRAARHLARGGPATLRRGVAPQPSERSARNVARALAGEVPLRRVVWGSRGQRPRSRPSMSIPPSASEQVAGPLARPDADTTPPTWCLRRRRDRGHRRPPLVANGYPVVARARAARGSRDRRA
jgi:hypothetical protein